MWEEDALEVLDAVNLQALDGGARSWGCIKCSGCLAHTASRGRRRDLLGRLDAHRAETREESAAYTVQTRAGDWEGDPRQHHAPGARSGAKSSTQGVILGAGVLGLAVEGASDQSDAEDEPLGKEGGDAGAASGKKNVGSRGRTRAEKAAVKFAKYGLDFELLKHHKLDLFHLWRFGGLML